VLLPPAPVADSGAAATPRGGVRQAIEGRLHHDGDGEPHIAWGGPLLAKSTMDTRAQRDESDEWRDWCVCCARLLAHS